MSVVLPAIWTAALVFASEFTLLQAGLSTVTYTPSDSKKVKEALKVPETLSVETIMPLGYSADDKPKEPRRALSELVYRNTMS
jgi:nitroreductase